MLTYKILSFTRFPTIVASVFVGKTTKNKQILRKLTKRL